MAEARSYECTHLCGRVFETRSQKEKHMRSCPRPKEPVVCSYGCGKSFSLRGMLRHKKFCDENPDRIPKRSWDRKPSPTITVACDECGEPYTKRSNGIKCEDGKQRCDPCKKETYRGKYRDAAREWRLKNYYGLTTEIYNRLLDLQGGVCAICKIAPKEGEHLPVDHDHDTGAVRGLLCHPCNRAVGVFQDDLATLRSAATYLLRHDSGRSWDHYFLEHARVAATRSKDPSSQVGAIIVRDRTILSTGYNGFPRGVNDDIPERYERPAKYTWVVHGEENAILNACRNGVGVMGATLYVTPFAPCVHCAKAIIQSGIREVVIDARIENPRWVEEFKVADTILKAAKVLVRGPE